MAVIEIEDLEKEYNTTHVVVHALEGVNLQFEQGEFAAVVGPSGSGKTTLLNMLGGLDEPTFGSIRIDGKEITGMKAREKTRFRLKNIGFVFQSYNLIPVLTSMENVEFIMHLQGWPKEKRRKRALEMLAAVGLEDRRDDRPSRLSGGQQQRVAVARALASRPRFILADEPTANLDSKSTENLLDIMEKLNHEEGTTFIFSTHDQRVVDKAHRIIRLVDGHITEDLLVSDYKH